MLTVDYSITCKHGNLWQRIFNIHKLPLQQVYFLLEPHHVSECTAVLIPMYLTGSYEAHLPDFEFRVIFFLGWKWAKAKKKQKKKNKKKKTQVLFYHPSDT